MLDFSPFLDLPLIWGGIIAFAIFLYVVLDGFDLGIGILFPFAPSENCRQKMMNSIAPFWDGNETWLVLGGGGLFAAFPLAYAILLSAFYIPLTLMLLGLIFRGVAFEFRFRTHPQKRLFWDYAFHFGSLIATFCQGTILGSYVEGVTVSGRSFAGHPFAWLSSFSLMTGVALIFGYALLGSTWTVMKTEGETQEWARKMAFYVLTYVGFFMGLVSLWVPFINDEIFQRWFSLPNLIYLSPIPLLTLTLGLSLIISLMKKKETTPFFLSISLFSLGYAGLAISLWPWIVPYQISLRTAAADPKSLSLMLIGVSIFLPVVLGYTLYSYYVFRGRSSHHELY
ncbi:MAG: cytochrome d ubiquinol oxidase subunit II [Alphaproteobacteria bacterium]|jgi:cytochrome d ubiquinol oxidase subunit II|nr:cytochrome d ubiquinol oxidase subunit II [Alphaproteobacteria bacterium]MBP7729222.1 cytochrome d ubiquinol oxidase subunit II [Alphaproteobacteria bacterium]